MSEWESASAARKWEITVSGQGPLQDAYRVFNLESIQLAEQGGVAERNVGDIADIIMVIYYENGARITGMSSIEHSSAFKKLANYEAIIDRAKEIFSPNTHPVLDLLRDAAKEIYTARAVARN